MKRASHRHSFFARGRWVWLCALLLLPVGGSGCQRAASGLLGGSAADNAEAVLIALSEARAWQRRADLLLLDGDLPGAIHSVEEVLQVPFPANTPEAEDVRLDAYLRLARLQLRVGGPEAEERALAAVESGRKLATRDSFFRAHLENAAADVYRARGERVTDPGEKRSAQRQELEAHERHIAIDKRLLRALLNLPPEPTKGDGR
ncbi:MAG TPA: hypothetical protein PKI03_03180 [Pseudomonadota bacterium]|nr:hypothetical protein [Pseudomonadota bacterium]